MFILHKYFIYIYKNILKLIKIAKQLYEMDKITGHINENISL